MTILTKRFALLFLALVVSAHAKSAGESDRFAAVNRAIAPLIALLTDQGSGGNHALDATAWVRQADGLPGQWRDAHIHLAFQFPDKLLLQFPLGQQTASICRNGQQVWAAPATFFAPLIAALDSSGAEKPIGPMRIDSKKAIILPALLDVQDGGTVESDAERFRVFDLRPISALGKKGASTWPIRLWTHTSDGTPAQIALRFAHWDATLVIEKLAPLPALPPETWQPPPDRENTVIVPPDKIAALLDLALKHRAP